MPIFKPEDLQDAKIISFSSQDMAGVSPTAGTPPDIATQARARLATGMGGGIPGKPRPALTPEQVKANPPTATTWEGPMADYGYAPTKLKAAPESIGQSILHTPGRMGANLLSSMDRLNQLVGFSASRTLPLLVDPKTGQPQKEFDLKNLNSTPAPLPPNSFANVSRDISGMTGLPIPDPTNKGMPRMFSDPYEASYKRLESGQSNSDMLAPAITAAAVFGGLKMAPKVGRALLPADIAAELSTKAQRASLGTTPENFTHKATPDVATLQDPAGSVYRSQGRQLKGIQADKSAEFDALENDMSAPKYQNKVSDPMTSINPVLDEATSRADPTQATRVGEFRSLVLSQVRKLSQGSMQLNPAQLVQLKRWMDGFISTYRDEPIGTVRDLAQNVRGAIKQHLETVAPESSVRGQRIQSLIQAEDALHNKIYTPMTEAKTTLGAIKNMFEPIVPSTLAQTATAALLKKMSGGLLDRPPVPTGTPGPTTPPDMGGAPPNTPGGGGGPQGPMNIPNRSLGQPRLGPATPGQVEGGTPQIAPSNVQIDFPEQPTHIEVGQQVSGHTPDGTLVSGELKKMYAVVENGVPQWKALVLDLKKGRIIDLPADQTFSRLEGPPGPKSESGPFDTYTSPFDTYTSEEYKKAGQANPNASNPFPNNFDISARLNYDYYAHTMAPNDNPYLAPSTAADTLGRAKSKPMGTPPVVVDRTKNIPGQLYSKNPVKPEEMALVKDAAARLADKFPGAIRNISRIELIDDRHIKSGDTFMARYESVPGGNVKINMNKLRIEIKNEGLVGADATLMHELTHSAQHVLGVKGPAETLEYPAYRNTFRTLGYFAKREGLGSIPLSPKEAKHGMVESWRGADRQKAGSPDQVRPGPVTKATSTKPPQDFIPLKGKD